MFNLYKPFNITDDCTTKYATKCSEMRFGFTCHGFGRWLTASHRGVALVRSQVSPRGVDKVAMGQIFILVHQFSAVNYHPTTPPYSFFTQWIANRPITRSCSTQTAFTRHRHNSVSIQSPSNSRCVKEDKHVFQTAFP